MSVETCMTEQTQGVIIGAILGFLGTMVVTQYQHYLQLRADRAERVHLARRDVIEALKVLIDFRMPFEELRDYVTAHLHLLGDKEIVKAWGDSVEDRDDHDKARVLYRLVNERFVDVALDYSRKYVEPYLRDKPPIHRRMIAWIKRVNSHSENS